MNKTKIIKELTKTLNRQFIDENKLDIDFVTRGGLNTAVFEQLSYDCSTVIAEYTDESLNYSAQFDLFFYIGEVPGHDFGGHKSEFILPPTAIEILPAQLTQALRQVAQSGKPAVIPFKDEKLLTDISQQ